MNGESVVMKESSSTFDSKLQFVPTGLEDVQGTSIHLKDVLFNVLEPNEPRLLVQVAKLGKFKCGEIELSGSFIKDNNLVVLGNYEVSPEIYP
ncbi:hypothetical protein F0267_00795 [Vibrio coralliilyticus]|uniref:Uncharacterized protein n=2 Tax=Vibrio TaxID=662 RepID=A0AAN0SHZ9_9VIBR|nr:MULTISPECIES: hypothetical protein [Vibrio]AIW22660.1 hypothetical protein IX92_26755 [Vibrio coralliilyticus]MCZ2798872.1 hypothetical protein [Vibrio alginolyticus]NOH36758.1 hypothetical protein [Vibrio coralliilyticus]POB46998.1 hypothetical protein CRN52_13045 [Vibrio vulnificus]